MLLNLSPEGLAWGRSIIMPSAPGCQSSARSESAFFILYSYFGPRTSTSPRITMLELYSAPGKCTLCHATFNFMLKTMQTKPTKLPPAKTHV